MNLNLLIRLTSLINGTSAPHLEKLPTNCGFGSDCSTLMNGINYWIYGHTHYNNRIIYTNKVTYKRTIILSNQRGYHRKCEKWKMSKMENVKNGKCQKWNPNQSITI